MPASEILSVEGVEKSFGDLTVLKGVSLQAGAGDVVSILGVSGSGKSTLLRCMNLLETSDAGRIVIDGTEIDTARLGPRGARAIDQKRLAQLRSHLAMVFQTL